MPFNLDTEVNSFTIDAKTSQQFDLAYSLDSVANALAKSPIYITDETIYQQAKDLVVYIPELSGQKDMRIMKTIFYTLTNSLQAETELIQASGSNFDASEHREVLYRHVCLVYMSVQYLNDMFIHEEKAKTKNTHRDSSKKKLKEMHEILSSILKTFNNVLNAPLSLILLGEQEPVEFCDVILKSIYSLMMGKEAMKDKDNKSVLINVFCLVACNYKQNEQVSSRLAMALPFSEHLPDIIAEIIAAALTGFGNKHLLTEVLLNLSDLTEYGANLAKHVSILLVRLSELMGTETMENIELFTNFEKTGPTIRSSVMIVYANAINLVSSTEENLEEYERYVYELIDTIEKHILDSYQIVRQKCFNALELIQSKRGSYLKFNEFRMRWTALATRHLDDKSSYVRKSAINLLKTIIRHHPFSKNDGRLRWSYFWGEYVDATRKLKEIEDGRYYNTFRLKELNDVTEREVSTIFADESLYNVLNTEERGTEVKDIFKTVGNVQRYDEDEHEEELNKISKETFELVLKRKYCRDACIFIKILDKSFEIAGSFLNSKLKSDTIAAIEYFTVGDAYAIESSKFGIKQMLHLIWNGGSNEDGNKVVEKLIDAYVSMFLTPFEEESDKNKTMYIASSLIKLTYNCSMADLISLEKMIVELCKGKLVDESKAEREKADYVPKKIHYITPSVIKAIESSFIKYRYFKERRGAIILLSMIALYDYRVAYNRIPLFLQYGLDSEHLNYQVATFTCIALRRVIPQKLPKDFIYPNFGSAIEKLKHILLLNTVDGDWYNLASEALNTLYEIDGQADKTATEILRVKALQVFSENENDGFSRTSALSQFFFLMGHVGIKTIIYLEKCESEFKRKKQEAENKKNETDAELDMINSREDDFTDAIQDIKEKEILFGDDSILAKFTPLLDEVITKPRKYPNKMLQRQATLCFAKFMCISSRYCEQHLNLYLSLMQNSKDDITRSNLVLGLGDVAVCFNTTFDEHKDALYKQLHDKQRSVQRTCLMTVTFLILAGQIKVKGQLSQLAKLVVHEYSGLRTMSRMFFQELATKDNAIYNGFIEMLSGLNLDMKRTEKLKKAYEMIRRTGKRAFLNDLEEQEEEEQESKDGMENGEGSDEHRKQKLDDDMDEDILTSDLRNRHVSKEKAALTKRAKLEEISIRKEAASLSDSDVSKLFDFNKFKEVIKFVLPFVNKDRQRYNLIIKLDGKMKVCDKSEYDALAFCVKELIKRDESFNKKDGDTDKSKTYERILEKIKKAEETRQGV